MSVLVSLASAVVSRDLKQTRDWSHCERQERVHGVLALCVVGERPSETFIHVVE